MEAVANWISNVESIWWWGRNTQICYDNWVFRVIFDFAGNRVLQSVYSAAWKRGRSWRNDVVKHTFCSAVTILLLWPTILYYLFGQSKFIQVTTFLHHPSYLACFAVCLFHNLQVRSWNHYSPASNEKNWEKRLHANFIIYLKRTSEQPIHYSLWYAAGRQHWGKKEK